MCGIFCKLSPSGNVHEHEMRAGLAALKHRGPDGDGLWISLQRTVAIGHTRLALIGVENGAQPLVNEDGTVRAAVNGEFYDFEKLRRELESLGHQFSTNTDSEILIHLYEEHGTECLNYLRGEFAFVLWDERQRLLFAARDRFGIKPLCFSQRGGEFLIASEAKALFAMGIKPEWDRESFFHSMSFQYTLPDRTLFAGVRQLRPGHFLIAKNGSVQTECYWDLDYARPTATTPKDESTLVEEFRNLLDESIRLRLRSDAPLCVHLSGGLDSSAVLGLAAQHSASPLHAFCVSFEANEYNEIELARESAAHAGAILHTVGIAQADLIEALPDAVFFSEGFAVNGHLPAKFILNREIRKAGFKAALTGEGADEIAAGYPHFRVDLFRAQGRDDLLESLIAANPASRGIMLAHGGTLALNAVRARIGFLPNFLEAKASLGFKLHAFLADGFKAEFAGRDPYSDLLDGMNLEQLRGRHPVNQSLYICTKTALSNYILRTLGDGAEMAHSIEGRVPFLDHRLFEFVRSLPMAMKINGSIEKFILREAARPFITERVYTRRKHPFLAPPLCRFSDSKSNAMIQDLLRGNALDSMPFIDATKVRMLLDGLDSMSPEDRTAFDPVLMTVLSAVILHSRYRL